MSLYVVRAILSLGKIGVDKLVAYASTIFNGVECNYNKPEKECLAIVWACHFRPYLLEENSLFICTIKD